MFANTSMLYLVSAICCIFAIQGLASPRSAYRGNIIGIIGMGIAVYSCLLMPKLTSYAGITAAILSGGIVGALIAYRIQMNKLPELIAGFHSLIGLSATLVSYASYINPEDLGIGSSSAIPFSAKIEISIGLVIGAITFSSSIIAFAKLAGINTFRTIFLHKYVLIALTALLFFAEARFVYSGCSMAFNLLLVLSLVMGVLLITPIGAADMPVVVSMLNSYSGWATAGVGFTLNNDLLIIVGALVGASGAILSYVMCAAMNRSIFKVIFSPFAASSASIKHSEDDQEKPMKVSNPEEAAYMMQNAQSIIIVPGYGMAVSRAQAAVKEMLEVLEADGKSVRFAIHPVAGRMPGHMNVLLAESDISYDKVFELEEINNDFASTDVVLVIGANDVTNPAAKTDPDSTIYGMPILEVAQARTVFFIKRSAGHGYAGVENSLFWAPNTMMLFGDAKKVVEEIVRSLKN